MTTSDSALRRTRFAVHAICVAGVAWVVLATGAYLYQFAGILPAVLRVFWKP